MTDECTCENEKTNYMQHKSDLYTYVTGFFHDIILEHGLSSGAV